MGTATLASCCLGLALLAPMQKTEVTSRTGMARAPANAGGHCQTVMGDQFSRGLPCGAQQTCGCVSPPVGLGGHVAAQKVPTPHSLAAAHAFVTSFCDQHGPAPPHRPGMRARARAEQSRAHTRAFASIHRCFRLQETYR